MGSTTFIDSTALTFGGSATPTLPIGRTLSDPINMQLDTEHDYYILMHVTAGTSASAAILQGSDTPSELGGSFISGDHTADATLPAAITATIYGVAGAFVA